MLARNSRLVPARRLQLAVQRSSSSFIRFTFAASAPSSSRFVTSTCPRSPRPRSWRAAHRFVESGRSGPREDEPQEQCQDESPGRDADDEIPRARRRTRVLCDQVVGLRRRRVGQHRGAPVEVYGEQLGPVTKGSLGRRPAPDVEMSRISIERRGRSSDGSGAGSAASSAGGTNPSLSGRVAGRMRASAFRTAPFSTTAEARDGRRPDGPDLVERLVHVLREQQPTWDASLWSFPYENARF